MVQVLEPFWKKGKRIVLVFLWVGGWGMGSKSKKKLLLKQNGTTFRLYKFLIVLEEQRHKTAVCN